VGQQAGPAPPVRTPGGRLDGMGLVLLLNGREVVALPSGKAVIRASNGNCLTHRRRSCDPLRSLTAA
jgi:hypothetical protein